MSIVQTVKGGRITLGPLVAEKLSPAYIAWMKDPEVLRFLADPDRRHTPEDLETFVRQMNESSRDHFFGIFINEDGRQIGNIKIGAVHLKHLAGDVGLVIGDKGLWGKGFATEAIGLAARYAFDALGLHKLTAGVVAGNEGSLRAFLKVGFREAGRYHEQWLVEGTRRDQYFVELLRSEYKGS